jgi:hypothetical protein
LGSDVGGLGFFVEPNVFDTFNITLVLSDGSSVSQAVNGNGGAQFFGWSYTGITGFQVNGGGDDFAIGDFFTATAVPGPIAGAGLPGLIAACGGLLVWWRRRQARGT